MKLNEFVDIIKETCTCQKNYDFKLIKNKEVDKDSVIFKSWIVGGKLGGDNEEERTAEYEPKFKELNKLLTKICPNITYLQYEDLSDIFKTRDNTEYDYYGVVYEYRMVYVIIEDLYNKLCELKLI